jgi:quercetin dioxygenase-like cupin family protein
VSVGVPGNVFSGGTLNETWKEEAMKKFPKFMRQPVNRVANSPDPKLEGFIFEGAEGTQIVFWECEKGGESPEHAHDFWEYCVVVEGSFDGFIEGEPVHCEAGDECVIPPGAKHSGRYSPGYRAIDAFGGKRVERISDKGTS